MRRRGVIGIAVGVAGLVAAGAAAGLAAESCAVGRIRSGPTPSATSRSAQLRPDRTCVVITDDGVPLHVEEVGAGRRAADRRVRARLALALGTGTTSGTVWPD